MKAVSALTHCRLLARANMNSRPRGKVIIRRRSKIPIAIAGIVLALLSPMAGGAADQVNDQKVQDWQIGFSPTYSSGNYGTNSTTSITYLPLSIRRLFDNGDLTFIVPYICISGNGAVTVLSGVPNRVSKSGNAAP